MTAKIRRSLLNGQVYNVQKADLEHPPAVPDRDYDEDLEEIVYDYIPPEKDDANSIGSSAATDGSVTSTSSGETRSPPKPKLKQIIKLLRKIKK